MKKILFPALATLMIAASPAAFAQTMGSWYVLADANTHACYAVNRTAASGEQLMGGPYTSQSKALSAIGGINACDGQWAP